MHGCHFKQKSKSTENIDDGCNNSFRLVVWCYINVKVYNFALALVPVKKSVFHAQNLLIRIKLCLTNEY